MLTIISIAVLNLGTIRRAEDPIRDTQTDPILYKQKMEQEKDGKKGPLLYRVRHNPEDTFFIDPPYTQKPQLTASETGIGIQAAETANWWEEEPGVNDVIPEAQESTGISSEQASESETSMSGSLSTQDVSGESETQAQEPSNDDYWW